MSEPPTDDLSPEVPLENDSDKEDDSNEGIVLSNDSDSDGETIEGDRDYGAQRTSIATTSNGQAADDDKHIYNSQIFNYNMIVDLVDEVYDEVYASDCQLMLIENKLDELKVRHSRALKRGRASIAYSLRVQMATVEGVKCMYDEYHARKRAKLDRLQAYSL